MAIGPLGAPAPRWDVNARGRRSIGVDLKSPEGVETLAGPEGNGTEAVEEDEGADHPAMGGGQGAPYLEAVADIAHRRQEDLFDFGGIGLHGHGGLPALVSLCGAHSWQFLASRKPA